MFQGNDLRGALIDLALTAKAKNVPLVVLVAGNIATQHAVRDIIDFGHTVWFTGKEQFKQGERIRLFETNDGGYGWERDNPILYQEEVKGRSIGRVGGKINGLQKIEASGYKTAPYFGIETSVSRRIIKALGLNKRFLALDQLSPDDRVDYISQFTKNIVGKITNYDGDLVPDLERALSKIGGNSFSVRSSATVEDGDKSFAGIFKTKLKVEKQGLRKAILKVIASAASPYAVKEALGANLKPSDISVAVIVQRMVDADFAGTIFTKDHLTDKDNYLRIEAVRGLGDQVVDATAKESQHILVDKETGDITSDRSLKSSNILNIHQVEKLAELGRDLEKILDEGPQDIEWAMKDEEIIVLQTRPL